jgi:hypothetical protein
MSPTIGGTVRSVSGEPVLQARVVIESAPGATPDIAVLTDANGQFILGTVGAGEYRLAAHADGYQAARATIAVADTPVRVELHLQPQRT